ncbi:hypothetical protein [Pontibacter cellulosilyticus]|uniref:Uncharacterized protein n=1 Tax=Pontibacter cellulosilyticus TaxID=1720253 RepID=A0A923NAI3_9BACT|nr:hypothetical protein [Pontibacter cellulosilyticus]MBC5994827.1 hypothetical protein [Pontibacter cellulosilyticus]
MKTSNKLLLGLLAVVLVSITVLLGTIKIYDETNEDSTATSVTAPTPPAAPEPSQE